MSPMLTTAILSLFSLIMLAAIYLIVRLEWHTETHPPEPLERKTQRGPSDDHSSVATWILACPPDPLLNGSADQKAGASETR
jgi:hypothetical protein